jgi:hypothetical protein
MLASDVLARSLGYDNPEALLGEPAPDRVRVEEESAVLDERGDLSGSSASRATAPPTPTGCTRSSPPSATWPRPTSTSRR